MFIHSCFLKEKKINQMSQVHEILVLMGYASSEDFGEPVQSCQSLCCLHTQNSNVDKGSGQDLGH